MKKFKVLLGILVMGIFLAGCDKIPKDILDIGGVDYSELDSAIKNKKPESLPDKQTFKAMILTEPFTLEVDTEELDGHKFVLAGISRSLNKPFILDVNDIKELPKSNFVEVEAEVFGTIYGDDGDNGVEEYLGLTAKKLTGFEPKESKELSHDSYTKDSIEYVPQKAVRMSGTNQLHPEDHVAIYYDFITEKNSKTPPLTPRFDSVFETYQGEEPLESSSDLDIDKSQLISGAVSDGTTEFSPGMKLNVYSILRLINDESEVEVAVYNDEFDLIFSKVLPIE